MSRLSTHAPSIFGRSDAAAGAGDWASRATTKEPGSANAPPRAVMTSAVRMDPPRNPVRKEARAAGPGRSRPGMKRCETVGLTAWSALAYAPAFRLALIKTTCGAFGLDAPT